MGMMPLFQCLGRAVDVFRRGRPLLWVCCSHHCHLLGFLAPLVLLFCTALWHSYCSERDRLLSKLIRGAVAALLVEESYPLTRSPRRMKSFQTGKLPGLRWWFWFLKSCVPVLFNNLNGFGLRLLWKYESQLHLVPVGRGIRTWIFSPFRSGVWGWLGWTSLPALGLSL